MKKVFFTIVFMLLLNVCIQAQDNYNYTGTVGNSPVSLSFTSDWDDDITTYKGSYAYKSVGKDIKLRGTWNARLETIELVEFVDVVTGYFSLKIANGMNELTGTWTSFDRKRVLNVKLKKSN